MSSTCFEPESTYSGRRLYIMIWYSIFYMHGYKLQAVLQHQQQLCQAT